MTWRPTNICQSRMPLTTAFAVIGLGVFRFPCGKPHPRFSLIYAIIITSLYYVVLGFTIDFCINYLHFGDTEKVVLAVIYANGAIAAVAQFFTWYHQNTCCRLLDTMAKVDETLQQLGVTFDYTRCFNLGIAVVVGWLILIVGLNSVDVLWFIDTMPIRQIIVVASILHHPFHVNSIVTFNFSQAVRLIDIRFRKANEILENLVTVSQHPAAFHAWDDSDTELKFPQLKISTQKMSTDGQNRKAVIQIIKHVHLELNSAAKNLNQAYGIQMALQIAADFILLTGNLYNMYTLLKNPSLMRRNYQLLVFIVWSLTHFIKLMAINEACQRLSIEAQRTGTIIHAIQESSRDPELSDEIHQFSLQMMQDPLFLSPIGFFTLGFPFVLGFLGTVTTYLVILIDMSDLSTRR